MIEFHLEGKSFREKLPNMNCKLSQTLKIFSYIQVQAEKILDQWSSKWAVVALTRKVKETPRFIHYGLFFDSISTKFAVPTARV